MTHISNHANHKMDTPQVDEPHSTTAARHVLRRKPSSAVPLDPEDRCYIDRLRGMLILRVVMAHLGLSWILLPYSSYIGMFFPALFAVSGIVTFYSFDRSPDLPTFLIRRLVRLYLPYFLVTILAFGVVAIAGRNLIPGIYQVIDWLLMNMHPDSEPYHLGQVWFLRSLVLITIMALPFYLMSRISVHFLLIPILLSLALAISHTYWDVGPEFWLRLKNINAFNLYHPFVNFGYYMFGAWLFATGKHKSKRFCLVLFGALWIWIGAILMGGDIDPDLGNHAYYQNLYFMALGYIGIVFLFLFRPVLSHLFSLRWVGWALSFFGIHAFTIYLTHSFFIELSEKCFGWINVIENIQLAFAKVLFVLIATCLTAVPLSFVAKRMTSRVIEALGRDRNHQVAN